MEKLYCLFNVSSNTLYTTISGCRPTSDYALLESLRSQIILLRPSNKSSIIEILETDSHCIPTAAAREMVEGMRKYLD